MPQLRMPRLFKGASKTADQDSVAAVGDGRDRRSTDPGATGDLSRRRKSNSGAVQAALGSETIAQIRPPSWFSRLRKGFRDGRKTEATQVGTRPQAVGTQEPEDAERLVAMPRFEGAGETNIEGTQLGVAGEVMQAKIRVFGITDESQLSEEEKALHDKLDKAKVRFSLPKEAGAGPAARTSTWVKDASEAMGQGVLAIAKEALGWRKASTLPDAVKWYREGQKDKPADSKKLSQEASLVLDQLTTTAVIERAEWALDIAPMLKNAEGTDSEIQDLLKTTLKEVKSKAIELSGKEAKLAKDKALDSLSGMMPVALRHQVQHDLAELSHRLDLASPNKSVPDVLGAKVLTEEVKRLFKGNLKEAARALHDLREVQPKDFCTLSRDLMKQPDARVLTRDGLIKNPMLRLVAALSRRTCGASMITAIVRPDGKSTEPLRVALRSVAAYQEEMQKNPAHPKISEAQRDWLCSGLEFACYTLSPSEEGRDRMKDEGPELTRHRRIAYRALQNGFTTNEPGSAYARVNAFLDFARGSELQETGRRNARAAAGFLGRTRNAITGGIGEATQWRKSALKQLSKAAAATGLFPTRDGAVDALNQTAVDVREALSERRYNAGQPGNVPLEPAEKLLLGVLEAANLGAWPLQHIDPKRLKRLTADFFDKAEAQLGPEGLESLGKGLREEWTGLRTSHPNIGHLFCRLFRNVDLRKIVHRGSKDAPPRNLQERGKRLDMHADRAIESFANLAHACVTATGGGDAAGQAAALAALACKTAAELKKVSPKAALGALRVDVFEKVENGLAQHQFHILPKEGRPSFQEVRRMVRDSWPPSVRADWDEMKASGVDVSRLLRHLTDALSRLLGDLPTGNTRPAKIVGADGVPESLPERVTDCVEDAEGALKALQRDIHVNRFELALCDTITMFNDVRCPMDAAAVLRSLSHRVSVGEKVKATDQQHRGLDIGKIFSFPIQFISGMPLTFGLGGSVATETSMDIAMNGAAVQMYLGKGQARGFTARAGLGITNMGALPLANLGVFQAGPRFDVIRADMQQEWAKLDGVTLRHIRTSGHEDQMRRSFGDILIDFMDPDALKTEDGQEYPDRLAALLDRNELLSVAELINTRRTSGTELSVGIGAFGKRKLPFEPNKTTISAGPVSVGLAAKTQAQDLRQLESASQLSIQEHKLSDVRRLELKRGAILPWTIPLTPSTSLAIRGTALNTRVQVLHKGTDSTLRIVTKNGETWAAQSQFIQEHELLEDFLESVTGYMHQYCRSAIGRDDVHNAPVGEKLGRAWNRISEVLDAVSKAHRPVDTYTRVLQMRPETGFARDRLESLAEIASDAAIEDPNAGMQEKAAEIRASVDELLSQGDAWSALNMQVKTKGRDEISQSVLVNILTGKAIGEATRLHEFLPLGAQNVGRTPNIPAAAPSDHSPPWSPSRPDLPVVASRREWTQRAEDMKQRLQNVQARMAAAAAEKHFMQQQMVTIELALDGRLKGLSKQRKAVEAAMRNELHIASEVRAERASLPQLRKASQEFDAAEAKLRRKDKAYAEKFKRFMDLDELIAQLKGEEESLAQAIHDAQWKAKDAPEGELPELKTTVDATAKEVETRRASALESTTSEVEEPSLLNIDPALGRLESAPEQTGSTSQDPTEADAARKVEASKETGESLLSFLPKAPPPRKSRTKRFRKWLGSRPATISASLAGIGATRTNEQPPRARPEESTTACVAELDPGVRDFGQLHEPESRDAQLNQAAMEVADANKSLKGTIAAIEDLKKDRIAVRKQVEAIERNPDNDLDSLETQRRALQRAFAKSRDRRAQRKSDAINLEIKRAEEAADGWDADYAELVKKLIDFDSKIAEAELKSAKQGAQVQSTVQAVQIPEAVASGQNLQAQAPGRTGRPKAAVQALEEEKAKVEELLSDVKDIIRRLLEPQHGLHDRPGGKKGIENLIACLPFLAPQPLSKMQTLTGRPLKNRPPREPEDPIAAAKAKHEDLVKDLRGRLEKLDHLLNELKELSMESRGGLYEIKEEEDGDDSDEDGGSRLVQIRRIEAELRELEDAAKQKTSLSDVQGIAAAAFLAFVKHKHVEFVCGELDRRAAAIEYYRERAIRRLDDFEPALAGLQEALDHLKEVEKASAESFSAYRELVERLKKPVGAVKASQEGIKNAMGTIARHVGPDQLARFPLVAVKAELEKAAGQLGNALSEAEHGMRGAEKGVENSQKMIEVLEKDITRVNEIIASAKAQRDVAHNGLVALNESRETRINEKLEAAANDEADLEKRFKELEDLQLYAVLKDLPGFKRSVHKARLGQEVGQLVQSWPNSPYESGEPPKDALSRLAVAEAISRSLAFICGGDARRASSLLNAVTRMGTLDAIDSNGETRADLEPDVKALFWLMADKPRGLEVLQLMGKNTHAMNGQQLAALRVYWEADAAIERETDQRVKDWLFEAKRVAATRLVWDDVDHPFGKSRSLSWRETYLSSGIKRAGNELDAHLNANFSPRALGAYNAVRNGYLSNADGSLYHEQNLRLLKLTTDWLEDTNKVAVACKQLFMPWSVSDAKGVGKDAISSVTAMAERFGLKTHRSIWEEAIREAGNRLLEFAEAVAAGDYGENGAELVLAAMVVARYVNEYEDDVTTLRKRDFDRMRNMYSEALNKRRAAQDGLAPGASLGGSDGVGRQPSELPEPLNRLYTDRIAHHRREKGFTLRSDAGIGAEEVIEAVLGELEARYGDRMNDAQRKQLDEGLGLNLADMKESQRLSRLTRFENERDLYKFFEPMFSEWGLRNRIKISAGNVRGIGVPFVPFAPLIPLLANISANYAVKDESVLQFFQPLIGMEMLVGAAKTRSTDVAVPVGWVFDLPPIGNATVAATQSYSSVKATTQGTLVRFFRKRGEDAAQRENIRKAFESIVLWKSLEPPFSGPLEAVLARCPDAVVADYEQTSLSVMGKFGVTPSVKLFGPRDAPDGATAGLQLQVNLIDLRAERSLEMRSEEGGAVAVKGDMTSSARQTAGSGIVLNASLPENARTHTVGNAGKFAGGRVPGMLSVEREWGQQFQKHGISPFTLNDKQDADIDRHYNSAKEIIAEIKAHREAWLQRCIETLPEVNGTRDTPENRKEAERLLEEFIKAIENCGYYCQYNLNYSMRPQASAWIDGFRLNKALAEKLGDGGYVEDAGKAMEAVLQRTATWRPLLLLVREKGRETETRGVNYGVRAQTSWTVEGQRTAAQYPPA